MVRVVYWYDNEWGYASRVVDVASHISDGQDAVALTMSASLGAIRWNRPCTASDCERCIRRKILIAS